MIHPHRTFTTSWLNWQRIKMFIIDNIIFEAGFEKMNMPNESYPNAGVLDIFLGILVGVISLLCGAFFTVAMDKLFPSIPAPVVFMSISYVAYLWIDIFNPVCERIRNNTIHEVKCAEIRDGLKTSSDSDIRAYYFTFRNHPLLSKWRLLFRVALVTAFYVSICVIVPRYYLLITHMVMAMYVVIKHELV